MPTVPTSPATVEAKAGRFSVQGLLDVRTNPRPACTILLGIFLKNIILIKRAGIELSNMSLP